MVWNSYLDYVLRIFYGERSLFMVITLEYLKRKRSSSFWILLLNNVCMCCYSTKNTHIEWWITTICPFRHIFKVCPCLTCCLQRHNNIVVHLVNVHLDMCTPQFHAFNIILQITRFLVFWLTILLQRIVVNLFYTYQLREILLPISMTLYQ